MNTEQLNAVVREIRDEIRKGQLLGSLSKLEKSLNQSVQNPGQPQFQEQISLARRDIADFLGSVEEQERPITKKYIIEEIGGERLLGRTLLSRIDRSLGQSGLVPAVVAQEISAINKELVDFDRALNNLIEGFDQLGLESDVLAPYAAELSILIPRRDQHEGLGSFAKDLSHLDQELQAFSELVTGSASEFRVRSLSSSEFQVFVDMLPEVAKVVTGAVVALLVAYDKLLDIRVKRKELRESGAPDNLIDEMDDWAEGLMKDEVGKLTTSLIENHAGIARAGRKDSELETSIRLTLKKTAKRIDLGYQYSSRIGELPEEIEDSDGENTEAEDQRQKQISTAEAIRKNSSVMQRRPLPGESVLPLSWKEPDEEI